MYEEIDCVLDESLLLVALPFLSASASAGKDAHRLRNSGTVLKETLDVPDDIPQNLLDKAECVAVFPSVLENTFGGSMVGGDVL
jgi:lipid-binding SYLF domain-containing protein